MRSFEQPTSGVEVECNHHHNAPEAAVAPSKRAGHTVSWSPAVNDESAFPASSPLLLASMATIPAYDEEGSYIGKDDTAESKVGMDSQARLDALKTTEERGRRKFLSSQQYHELIQNARKSGEVRYHTILKQLQNQLRQAGEEHAALEQELRAEKTRRLKCIPTRRNAPLSEKKVKVPRAPACRNRCQPLF